MDLIQRAREAIVSYEGVEHLTMPEGAHLRFKNTAGEGNFLSETVPAGKQWQVTITVHVVETDAA